MGGEKTAQSKKEVSITLWSEAEKLSEIQANFISYDKQSLMLLFHECSETFAKIFEKKSSNYGIPIYCCVSGCMYAYTHIWN